MVVAHSPLSCMRVVACRWSICMSVVNVMSNGALTLTLQPARVGADADTMGRGDVVPDKTFETASELRLCAGVKGTRTPDPHTARTRQRVRTSLLSAIEHSCGRSPARNCRHRCRQKCGQPAAATRLAIRR
jgi:hypothetical protein